MAGRQTDRQTKERKEEEEKVGRKVRRALVQKVANQAETKWGTPRERQKEPADRQRLKPKREKTDTDRQRGKQIGGAPELAHYQNSVADKRRVARRQAGRQSLEKKKKK